MAVIEAIASVVCIFGIVYCIILAGVKILDYFDGKGGYFG